MFCFFLGAGYTAVLYFNNKKFSTEKNPFRDFLLATLRFLSVSLIAFLLLSPLIKKKTVENELPTVAFLIDNSASIAVTNSPQKLANLKAALEKSIGKIGDKYAVKIYGFGSEMHGADSLYSYAEKSTNIANALKDLDNTFYNQNLVATVLVSDGIYTAGNNPLYTTLNTNSKIYTIGIGDTTAKRDIFISDVRANPFMYVGDKTTVEVSLGAYDAANTQTRLTISEIGKNGQSISRFSENISISNASFQKDISTLIEGKTPGIMHLRIAATAISNEVTVANNVRDVFIEIIDSKKKILVYAHAPHPDIAAIKQIAEKSKNYELVISYADKPIPAVDEFSLVILHQLPSMAFPATEAFHKLVEKNIPMFFILGSQTNLTALNQLGVGLSCSNSGAALQEIQPILNTSFDLFTLSNDAQQYIMRYPPLLVPYGGYKIANANHILLKQKIGNVETAFPLLAFSEQQNKRAGFLIGEGFWKWRLTEFQQRENQQNAEEILLKTIQYLAVKQDKKPFKVNSAKQVYDENEPVILNAYLYNAAYEPINTPDVTIVIQNEAGKNFSYTCSKTANGYVLNTGFLPAGSYSYAASVNYNSKKLTASGSFSIRPLQIEYTQTKANFGLLKSLAQQHKGQFYLHTEIEKATEEILNQTFPTYSFETNKIFPLTEHWFLFAAIVCLLALEWFLRKYWGGY